MKLAAHCCSPAPLLLLRCILFLAFTATRETRVSDCSENNTIFRKTIPKADSRVRSPSVHSTWGFSHFPSVLQRTTGGWRCVNPGLHWYRMMELTGYSSLLLPNIWAFSTSGGAPQDTKNRIRGHGASSINVLPSRSYGGLSRCRFSSFVWFHASCFIYLFSDRQWRQMLRLNQHTWAFLAGKWQVVVAGHVVPLAVLMPDHHHTVFSRVEVIVRLVRPPVLVLLKKEKHTLTNLNPEIQNPIS